jgi:hypothetical protein
MQGVLWDGVGRLLSTLDHPTKKNSAQSWHTMRPAANWLRRSENVRGYARQHLSAYVSTRQHISVRQMRLCTTFNTTYPLHAHARARARAHTHTHTHTHTHHTHTMHTMYVHTRVQIEQSITKGMMSCRFTVLYRFLLPLCSQWGGILHTTPTRTHMNNTHISSPVATSSGETALFCQNNRERRRLWWTNVYKHNPKNG